jgi:rhomboid family GlyGly-CTERM serine protease
MPRDLAAAAASLAAALQLDRGRWIWLLLIVGVAAMLLAMGEVVGDLLRYDRGAIAAGGWWRLLTAHFIHLDAHHLVLNGLGLVLIWSLFGSNYDAVEWLAIAFAGALGVSCGLWWLSPGVAWYVGASGVLHTLMAAGIVKHMALRDWDRWILAVGLALKLAYERFGGPGPPLVVIDAHAYGALAGVAMGAVLCARTAIIRHRFSA